MQRNRGSGAADPSGSTSASAPGPSYAATAAALADAPPSYDSLTNPPPQLDEDDQLPTYEEALFDTLQKLEHSTAV